MIPKCGFAAQSMRMEVQNCDDELRMEIGMTLLNTLLNRDLPGDGFIMGSFS